MAYIEFKNVNKFFGDVRVIDDFSLGIEKGELMVLVGPSGCGKSTLLRMVAGLEPISSGTISLGGTVINHQSPRERNVAMVFQNYALYPHMTVRQNLAFPLKMQRCSRSDIRRKVAGAAELLGLNEFLDRKPGKLSGGQRQRVAMGRAIVRDPSVFLMDEPLSNLDAGLRVRIRSEIAGLQRRMKTTTLYVTHDQAEAMTLGHRVAVLKDGRIQQTDDPATLYEKPGNVFVAGFIGSPGMNIWPARLYRDTDRWYAEVEGARLSLPQQRAEELEAIAGQDRKILLGLRPEAFGPAGDYPEEQHLPIETDTSEMLGHELILYGHLLKEGSEKIRAVARLDPEYRIEPGTRLTLGVNTAEIHLFDPENGQRFE